MTEILFYLFLFIGSFILFSLVLIIGAARFGDWQIKQRLLAEIKWLEMVYNIKIKDGFPISVEKNETSRKH